MHCIDDFKHWARANKRRLDAQCLDKTVNAYITLLCKNDVELWTASYLIYGLQPLECAVPKDSFLTVSKQSLSGWRRESPGGMRLPVPEEFLRDVATEAVESGRLDIAVAMVLQYDGYLRPSECLTLTSEQIGHPQGKRYPHWSVVIAPSTLQQQLRLESRMTRFCWEICLMMHGCKMSSNYICIVWWVLFFLISL